MVASNINGLIGGSASYYIAKQWTDGKMPVVVVCGSTREAEMLADDIRFFSSSVAPGPIEIFDDPGVMPYTHMIPQPDVWIERLKTLYVAANESAPLIIAPISALLRKVPPEKLFFENIHYVHFEQELIKEKFQQSLVEAGYNNSPLVEDWGDFASRGNIIDLWSPINDRPARIELDGDRVVSIRSFDPATQRTSFEQNTITIIPARSVMLNSEVLESGLKRLKQRADDSGVAVVERREFVDALKRGVYPAYTETLLPIFHPDAGTILDYLKKDAVIFINEPIAISEEYRKHFTQIGESWAEAEHIEKVVRPEELYLTYEEWERALEKKKSVVMNELAVMHGSDLPHPASPYKGEEIIPLLCKEGLGEVGLRISSSRSPLGTAWIEGSSKESLSMFLQQINAWQNQDLNIIFVCHTELQADRLIDILRWQGLAPIHTDESFACLQKRSGGHLFVTIGSLSEGFVWADERVVLISEKDLFGKKRKKVAVASTLPTEMFSSYQELAEGDHLVHITHGVGRYHGMTQMEFGGMRNDFLLLEYLGGDKLYVPAYRLNLVQKYVGPGEGAPFLDKLGGKRWEKAKLKANRAVRRMAAELLRIYATRKIKEGFQFSPRDQLMEEFESQFPYDETPDQAVAIEDALKDMMAPYPADRLICGDVGYGKTEVAIRAAFKAAMDGKQVAVLVPTTILAFQHFETFKERFKNTPIKIDVLNRFRTTKEQKEVLEGLRKGDVNVVVGTHRLLSKDVAYNDLGLLIIDEEHRFGVRQKEMIKKFRATIDVISMSATPIPRTLHFSLVGVRDISVINTPPANRRAIRTYVAEFDEGLIKGAVMKEVRRGGQVFFLHNRIESIQSMRDRLVKMMPDVRVAVAHGQLKEHELERVMVDFVHKKFDMLLTTAIIESGLDIPSANTIIINRADTFGLAQLYQIRGRVGRSSEQAFAYLMIPSDRAITAIASKRLAALQRYTELGSGFQIAMHDLEIRGSGNLLGAEQSGHISAIGYELYTELLEREIRKMKGEREEETIDTEIQIPVQAFIPASYMEDNGTRVVFYKRLSALKNSQEIDDMSREITDRFGPLPNEVINLLKVIEIKTQAAAIGIDSVQMAKNVFVYKFSEKTKTDPQKILALLKKDPKKFMLKPPATVVIRETADMTRDVFYWLKEHLRVLSA